MKLADAITIVFLTIVTVVGLFTNGHVFLPSHFYLKYVIDSFIRDKKHYLLLEKPDFFRALLYCHLLVNWPLAVISLYGLTFQKSWLSTTSLILAVSFASISVSYPPVHSVFFLKWFNYSPISQLKLELSASLLKKCLQSACITITILVIYAGSCTRRTSWIGEGIGRACTNVLYFVWCCYCCYIS